MSKTFELLHKVTRKNLTATGDRQNRSFFYARVGADTLLYVGSASEKKLNAGKVSAHLDRLGVPVDRSLDRVKWMTGTVKKRNDKKERYDFRRSKGTAKAEPIVELHLRKVFKDISITGVKITLMPSKPLAKPKRSRQRIRAAVETSGADTASMPGHPPAPGPDAGPGGPPAGPGHDGVRQMDAAGHALRALAPEILSTAASAINARQELKSDDATWVEKTASTLAAGGSATELTAHGVALATNLDKARKAQDAMSSLSGPSGGPPGGPPDGPPKGPPDGPPHPEGSSPKAHLDRAVRAHKSVGKMMDAVGKVGEIAGDISVGAGVVYSGAKAVRAGKALHDATEQKEALRKHIRHMKVVDALQKRFANQETPDIKKDPVVRTLVDRFKREAQGGRVKVGKKDVIDTLRLFVEVKTSSQRQSGVDLVANALKLAGGAATLSGVGAAVGAAMMMAGTGVQVAKVAIDKGVEYGRERKHDEEMALRTSLETAVFDEDAKQKMATLVEIEQSLMEQADRTRALRSTLRDKKRELAILQEEAEQQDDMHSAMLEALSEVDNAESDEEMMNLDEVDSMLNHDLSLDDLMGEVLDDVEQEEIAEEIAELQAALQDSLDRARTIRETHKALEKDINETLLPEIFADNQQQRLGEILDGKERRKKVIDGRSIGFMERLKHETSVNEDASEEAMAERRQVAVDVLMSGSIPPFLRQELIGMLGIDAEGWEKLQEADAPTRREALRLLMVV